MKKRIKILSSTIALLSIGVSVTTSTTLINNILNAQSTNITNSSNTKNDSTTDLIPAQANGQNANISTISGPVTYWNNTITALDWYGNKLWDLDMSTLVSEPSKTTNGSTVTGGYNGSWKRAWYNWDYNRSQNILWILGYAYNSNQTIFGINASTGSVEYTKDIGNKNGYVNGKNQPYKFISALSSGKVLAYGDPVAGFNGQGTLYDPKTNTYEEFTGDSYNHVPNNLETKFNNKYKWFFFNLVPVGNNLNIAEVAAIDKRSGITGDGSKDYASYNVYGLLVDDKLNFIGDSQPSGSSFNKPFRMGEGMPGFRNSTITPQRDYYTLLNNQTVTVTYNNVSIIDASNPSNVKITQVKMTSSKWILTWTVDANDNLYFKFKDDRNVYRISGDSLKSNQTAFSPSTYLDLGGVNDENVKKNANNFLIYNVYGYTGQLMMVNANYYDYINIYDPKNNKPDVNENNTNQMYGLAIAVVPNKSNNNSGDLKGLLNTSKSFQQPADFTINQNALNSKIPSEISRQDIELMNGAFFKDDDKKPFIIYNIDDSKGTFKVTANLYKIPWFASTLPKDSIPKVITYDFNGTSGNKAKDISSKVSWKKLDSSSDYDFLNMLPKNVTEDDLNNLNPFQASFQSQTIVDSSGKQLYPKTKYSIGSRDDSNGTIQVKVEYQYVPMGVTYTGDLQKDYQFGKETFTEKQVLTYTGDYTYNIFKQNGDSAFYFMGANKSVDNEEQSIDVNTVPQLKSLISAGTLPSSFSNLNSSNDSSNSAFLQFINTSSSKGYPISKMNFKVTPNDSDGTLSISATMPSQYSPDNSQHTYLIKYTGLNKNNSYTFSFKKNDEINGTKISNMLPSSVDEGDIVKNFISYSGFNSNDFNVILNPDDINGTLSVQINLNKDYASIIGNSNGFNNYSISTSLSGFMTTSQYNSRFSISFKGDDDASLLKLKSIQANEIVTAFVGNGSTSPTNSLTIDGKEYKSLNEFIKGLLVSSTGSSIPEEWNSTNVKSNVYVDNNLGIASFYINIPKANVPGATSDLNFAITYSGFVKGNQVPTQDNLSFVSNAMLKNYLLTTGDFDEAKIKSLTPESFAGWANSNINKLITYKTGEYKTKLEDKSKYTLTITPNVVQSTVTITIDFGKMTDTNSLSEYTVQYTI